MSLRKEVLNLYKHILRFSYKWESSHSPGDTEDERKYIREEARRLFRKNKDVKEEDDIRDHIKEAETRIVLAMHYKNPYPRPVHLPQNVLHSPASRRLKVQTLKLEQSKPLYIKSYKDET